MKMIFETCFVMESIWHLKKGYVRGAGDFPAQADLKQKIQEDSKSVWESL